MQVNDTLNDALYASTLAAVLSHCGAPLALRVACQMLHVRAKWRSNETNALWHWHHKGDA